MLKECSMKLGNNETMLNNYNIIIKSFQEEICVFKNDKCHADTGTNGVASSVQKFFMKLEQ